MLKIDANPIDQCDFQLDLKCFLHLFPYGKNGQYFERSIKLMPN